VDDVARDWGANGLAHLTGLFGGPPDFSRAAMLTRVREVAATLSRADNVDAALPAAPTVTTCAGELGSDNARVNQMVSERSFAAC
jgi:hypothetical protein